MLIIFIICTFKATFGAIADEQTSRQVFSYAPPRVVRKDPGQTVELRWMVETNNYTLLTLKCGLLRPEQTEVIPFAEQTSQDIALRALPKILVPEQYQDRVTVSYPTSLIINNLRKEDTNFYGCLAVVYSKNGFETITARTQTELLVGVQDATGSGTATRTGDQSYTSIIIGVVLVIILAVVAALAAIYISRRRKRAGKTGFSSSNEDPNRNMFKPPKAAVEMNGRSPGSIQRLSRSDIVYSPVEVTSTPMDAISRHDSAKIYCVSELDRDERHRATSTLPSNRKEKDEWC